MTWTLPATWTAGQIVTNADLNTHLRDNLRYLKGIGQVPTISSGLVIDNTDGDEYFKLPLHTTSECSSVLNAESEVAYDGQTHRIKYYSSGSVESLLTVKDVDDIPVNGASTDPISSNWAYDFANILTSAGDIPYASASGGTWTRLGIGAIGQSLRVSSASIPIWTTVAEPIIVYKTTDESVSGTTTLQNDNELVFAIGASQAVQFILSLIYAADTTPDFKFAFTASSVATMYYEVVTLDTNNVLSKAVASSTDTPIAIYGTGNNYTAQINGIAINGANAGNVQFQWAQNTSASVAVYVRQGSHITYYVAN